MNYFRFSEAYYFLKRYVVGSVRQLMEKSYKSCLFLGGVPLFYYLFDYMTAIYTDVLYSGAEWAVQFMPSTISVFYFVFVILRNRHFTKDFLYQKNRGMVLEQKAWFISWKSMAVYFSFQLMMAGLYFRLLHNLIFLYLYQFTRVVQGGCIF